MQWHKTKVWCCLYWGFAQDGKTSKMELLLLSNLNIFFTSAFPKFKKTQQHLETISLNSPTILHLLVLFCSC